LPYSVELWTDDNARPERILARCGRVDIARGAFEASVKVFPDKNVLLKDGTRVVMSATKPA
jgi:hypothetical protein